VDIKSHVGKKLDNIKMMGIFYGENFDCVIIFSNIFRLFPVDKAYFFNKKTLADRAAKVLVVKA
jgi:hypothetical protein